MNYEFSEDQTSVLTGLEQLLSPFRTTPVDPVNFVYSAELNTALSESGFLDIASVDGFGLLDAALVVEQVALVPQVVEVAASALIGPVLPLDAAKRPIALLSASCLQPARFLPVAEILLVLHDDHVDLVHLDQAHIEPVESLFAYPIGKLKTLDGLHIERFDDAEIVRRRWQVAIAVEGAGCMAAALEVVLEHVKTRFAFGRALGSFQAIQHRLAMAAEVAESAKWLARRAAWSDTAQDAAVAAAFVQSNVARFTYDLHQFSGAMGLTLEYPLHFWTYRLRALASDLGGSSAQTRLAASSLWPEAA